MVKFYPDLLSQTKNNKYSNCCSKKCSDLYRSFNLTGEKAGNWQGGSTKYYGPSWPLARKKARERDNNACLCCGLTGDEEGRNISVHHWIRFIYFDRIKKDYPDDYHLFGNQLDNLICLCNSRCHLRLEAKVMRAVKAAGAKTLVDLKLLITENFKQGILDWTRERIKNLSKSDLTLAADSPIIA